MTIDSKCRWAPSAVILAALCTVASATSLAQNASSPEEHLASINAALRQSSDYENGLAAAMQSEKRDKGWATQTESALRGSFATEDGLPHDALRSVECRSSKCKLELSLGAGKSPAPSASHAGDREAPSHSSCASRRIGGPASGKLLARFARDSPLEGTGFEPSVPPGR
jgi:hypothetical protein